MASESRREVGGAVRSDAQGIAFILLTKREIARALRLSVRSVDRLVNAGEIHSMRLGRSVRFPASELNRLVDRHLEAGPTQPQSEDAAP